MADFYANTNQNKEGSPQAEPSLSLYGFVGDSIVDGPGLRCVVFTQGCPHHCEGCHNPDSHAFSGGTAYTPQQIFAQIQKYPLCKGVTFSGGEPFCQAEGLYPLALLLKGAGYELAAYTGYTFEQLLQGTPAQRQLLSQLDTLIDGPFTLSQKDLSLRFRGSKNQRILHVAQSLQAGKAVLETATRWTG